MKKILSGMLSVLALTACGAKVDKVSATSANGENQNSNNSNVTTGMAQQQTPAKDDAKVLIHTTEGDIEILLYGDTPKHQENFLKLVKEGYYDGTLFHRVINEFMVQAGDPDSKGAPAGQALGQGGPGYQIDAEFVYPKHFHKRGALAAARTADQVNPERKSSGSQFYIVTGKTYSEAELNQLEQQMKQGEMQNVFYKIASERRNEIMRMQQAGDFDGLQKLQDEILAIAEQQTPDAKMTEEQRKAYSTEGGTPFLDNQYTVFGEVIKGMDVVSKIEKTETGANDRPKQDVKILSMEIIK